jgi:hypothetical protein
MPVKGCLMQSGALSDGRHDDISAIPRITGDREAPCPLLGSDIEAEGKRQ